MHTLKKSLRLKEPKGNSLQCKLEESGVLVEEKNTERSHETANTHELLRNEWQPSAGTVCKKVERMKVYERSRKQLLDAYLVEEWGTEPVFNGKGRCRVMWSSEIPFGGNCPSLRDSLATTWYFTIDWCVRSKDGKRKSTTPLGCTRALTTVLRSYNGNNGRSISKWTLYNSFVTGRSCTTFTSISLRSPLLISG